MSKNSSRSLRRLTVSAVLLAIALVLKTFFSFYIPLFGQNGMRISVSGIFSMMPSFLFGPWYGAAVSGLSDLMGYVLKPSGAYMPLLTLTAALGGFLRGGLFFLFKNRKDRTFRLIVLILSVLLLIFGIAAAISLRADGVDSGYYDRVAPEDADPAALHAISRLVVERTKDMKDPAGSIPSYIVSLIWGPLGCGITGLLLLAVDLAASRFIGGKKIAVPAMLLATIISGLAETTVNTVILRETVYASWKVLPFGIVWVPRAIEEIMAGAAKVCLIAVLMKGLEQIPGARDI